MINELCDVLRRETEATLVLEGRLRALERIVAADDERCVALALDEMDIAADNLAALGLIRVLALSIAGLAVEGLMDDVVAVVGDPAERLAMRELVTRHAAATKRLEQARDSAEAVVASRSRVAEQRLRAVKRFSVA